jgi:hypothetical protein
VVGALLAKGADIEAKGMVSITRACALCPSRCEEGGSYGETAHYCSAERRRFAMPLLNASFNGHTEVVGVLLVKSADTQAKCNVSIARDCALCPSHSRTHMQKAHGCL